MFTYFAHILPWQVSEHNSAPIFRKIKKRGL
nr:MAG TPA: hypothetical protein [Caudoviricetes sp.]